MPEDCVKELRASDCRESVLIVLDKTVSSIIEVER